jgi:uncharacterized protein
MTGDPQRPLDRGWFFTRSGKQVWPLALRPEDICVEDIAHSLSRQNRFLGHTALPYSVAQHSVLVGHAIWEETRDAGLAMWGLLHDASEAYLGDIINPIKHSGTLDGYLAAEVQAMRAICQRFGLPEEEPAIVKLHDKRALATERRDLVPAWAAYRGPSKAGEEATPHQATIVAWHADAARAEFLLSFWMFGGRP